MIIKVTPDKEKVKSILYLIKERENFTSSIDYKKFPTNATENYYEIIKELANALLLLSGLKTTGEYAHKDLIDFLINYKEFTESDILFMNDLRIKRNNSSYEGKNIESSYLENNKKRIIELIDKLKKEIRKKLENRGIFNKGRL
jgi:hypothetical protein